MWRETKKKAKAMLRPIKSNVLDLKGVLVKEDIKKVQRTISKVKTTFLFAFKFLEL